MKSLGSFEKPIGDAGKVSGAAGFEDGQLKAKLEVSYPAEKVAEPLFRVTDGMVDKIEQLIPGDQKEMAERLKAEARSQILKILTE